MKLITAEQRSPEWFAARLGKATASNFGNVLAAKTTAAYRNYRVRLALERLTGKRKTAIYDAMRTGKFPTPVRIGPKAVAWRASDIAAWQAALPQGGSAAETLKGD